MTKQNVHAEGVVAAYFATGSQALLKREGTIVYRKEGARVKSLNTVVVYSKNKTWVEGKC